jgi:hypothetical protein
MNKLMLAAVAFSVFVSVSQAQDTPQADVAVGYSRLGVRKGYTLTLNGGSGSVAFNVNNWLGVVGDFGVNQVTSGSLAGLTAETYTFGSRFSYRRWHRFILFAEAVLGGVHASEVATGFTDASNAFAFGGGVGVDIGLDSGGRVALRPQLESYGFRAKGSTTNTNRFSIGIVFRIGKK